jgi:hypothetical protein
MIMKIRHRISCLIFMIMGRRVAILGRAAARRQEGAHATAGTPRSERVAAFRGRTQPRPGDSAAAPA